MATYDNQTKSQVTTAVKFFLEIDDAPNVLLIDDFSATGHKLIISTGSDTSPIEWNNRVKS